MSLNDVLRECLDGRVDMKPCNSSNGVEGRGIEEAGRNGEGRGKERERVRLGSATPQIIVRGAWIVLGVDG
jgi:hypothetical protein